EVGGREAGGEHERLELARAPGHGRAPRRVALDALEPAGGVILVAPGEVLESGRVLDRDQEGAAVGEAAACKLEVRAGRRGRVFAKLRVIEVAVLEYAYQRRDVVARELEVEEVRGGDADAVEV